jgi:hypothetical protein
MNNIQELNKMASDLWTRGEIQGANAYNLFKAAAAGHPQAIAIVKQAQEMAEMAAQEAAAGGAPAAPPAAEDGSAPGTAGPAGIMVCPVCGSQMTPTLDMTCPVCGSDVSQAVNEAVSPQQPPMAAPAPEAEAEMTEQVVQAAANDPNWMSMLISNYGHLV